MTTVFEIGDLLAKGGDMAAQAVVLDKTEDGARLLLMTLPAGEYRIRSLKRPWFSRTALGGSACAAAPSETTRLKAAP